MEAAVERVSGQPRSSRARHGLLEGGGWHEALLPSSAAVAEPHASAGGGQTRLMPGGNSEKSRKVNAGLLNKILSLELRCALLGQMV